MSYTPRPIGEEKKETLEWIKSGAMQSARYEQLQCAYKTCFGVLNLRLNKTQLKTELLKAVREVEKRPIL